MGRDDVLLRKDRVQKQLWRESGGDTCGYGQFIHKKAAQLRRTMTQRSLRTTAKAS